MRWQQQTQFASVHFFTKLGITQGCKLLQKQIWKHLGICADMYPSRQEKKKQNKTRWDKLLTTAWHCKHITNEGFQLPSFCIAAISNIQLKAQEKTSITAKDNSARW